MTCNLIPLLWHLVLLVLRIPFSEATASVTTATFDDLPFTPPIEQLVGIYRDLSWQSLSVGGNAINLGGVLSNTPSNRAAFNLLGSIQSGSALQPGIFSNFSGSTTTAFALKNLCYACDGIPARGLASVAPSACTIAATAFAGSSVGFKRGTQKLVYQPDVQLLDDGKILTANMTCTSLDPWIFQDLRFVTFTLTEPAIVGYLTLSMLFDTVEYELL